MNYNIYLMKFVILVAMIPSTVIMLHLEQEDCIPFTLFPSDYDVTIIPCSKCKDMYYRGEVIINVIVTIDGINTISLDCQDLNIGTVGVFTPHGVNIIDDRRPFTVDRPNGKLYIYLKESMIADENVKYTIRISFVGHLRNSGESGLFIRSYEEYGKNRWYIGTRNTPNFASTIFPCFDEPKYKSTFRLRIYRELEYTRCLALTKTHKQINNGNEYQIHEYLPTPQISTYQVAFVTSNLERNQRQNENITLWCNIENSVNTEHILTYVNSLLTSMELYVHDDFIGKINLVALPNYSRPYEKGSFSLITVGASKLLIDNKLTSAKQIERNLFELTKHLSRVWLANPYSRSKFKEQWFKDGLSSYYGVYFMSNNYKDLTDREYFTTMHTLEAMKLDQLIWSQSLIDFNISEATTLTSDVERLITLKTSSLISMIEYWIGSDVFHDIMMRYLNIVRGNYITFADFARYLHREFICEFFKGYTMLDVLNTWISNHRYPIVDVSVIRNRNIITLSQKQFNYPNSKDNKNFLIPISYTTQTNENCINCHRPRFVIGKEMEYSFHENLNGGWIILNRNATGYFRVNYDPDTWELIIKTLNSPARYQIDRKNRAQIINDAFALYLIGDMSDELSRSVVNSIADDTDYLVWSAALNGFEMLREDDYRITEEMLDNWKMFMRSRITKVYNIVTSNYPRRNIELKDRLFRSTIMKFACSIDYPPCIQFVKRITNNLNKRSEDENGVSYHIDSDLREACFIVATNEDSRNHRLLESYYKNSDPYTSEDYVSIKNWIDKLNSIKRPLFDPRPYQVQPSKIAENITMCTNCFITRNQQLNSSGLILRYDIFILIVLIILII